jgi:hypothetical protein
LGGISPLFTTLKKNNIYTFIPFGIKVPYSKDPFISNGIKIPYSKGIKIPYFI